MIGRAGLKFGKGRLGGEMCSQSILQAYTSVIRNKAKITQAARRLGVSGNQPAMRHNSEITMFGWFSYLDYKMRMRKRPEQDLGQ